MSVFEKFGYVPLLTVRPAELMALEHLSASCKSNILPMIPLKPWASAVELSSTTDQIENAFPGRPLIIDITKETLAPKTRRNVHDEIDGLKNPERGYEKWCSFVEGNDNFLPVIQIENLDNLEPQVERLASLSRGIVVHLTKPSFGFSGQIAGVVKKYCPEKDVLFILDREQAGPDLLTSAMLSISLVRQILDISSDSYISVAATSFPQTFVGLTNQEIYERSHFEMVATATGAKNIIYCDHGSARCERQKGGGGEVAPRIDNALTNRWDFFREVDFEDKVDGYQSAAQRAIDSDGWADLSVWGTQIIKETADGAGTIYYPTMSTAARINIHLNVQAGVGAAPVEEIWED